MWLILEWYDILETVTGFVFISRREENSTSGLVEQFISRKADLLFCPSWKITTQRKEDYEEEEATGSTFLFHIVLKCF